MSTQVLSDEQTKKVFAEGQARLFGLSRQLSSCKAEIFQRDRNIRMASLTLAELDKLTKSLPDDQKLITYQSVGKMFKKVDADSLTKQMKERAEKDKRDINILDKTREYLEGSMNELEKNLRDMLEKRTEK